MAVPSPPGAPRGSGSSTKAAGGRPVRGSRSVPRTPLLRHGARPAPVGHCLDGVRRSHDPLRGAGGTKHGQPAQGCGVRQHCRRARRAAVFVLLTNLSIYMKEQHALMHGPTEEEDVLPSSAHLLEETARLLEGSGEDVAPARRSGRGEVGARRGGRRRLVVDTGRRGCYRLQRNRHVREALEDLVLDKIGDKFSFGRIRQTTSTN